MVNGYWPRSLAEAVDCMAQDNITPCGGGTDLMLKDCRQKPLLFLGRLPEATAITQDDDFLRLGAAVSYTALLDSPLTPPLLKAAIGQIAAPAIRNLGTLGGNIANASPKADGALACFPLDAQLRIAGPAGERQVPIRALYLGRRKVDISPQELIVEVLIPKGNLAPHYFEKVGGRAALAISRVSFAGCLERENGRIVRCAVAFGGVADTILCHPQLDNMLLGKTVDEAKALREEYLTAWQQAITPTAGRVSAAYRSQVCHNLLEDFLSHMGL